MVRISVRALSVATTAGCMGLLSSTIRSAGLRVSSNAMALQLVVFCSSNDEQRDLLFVALSYID